MTDIDSAAGGGLGNAPGEGPTKRVNDAVRLAAQRMKDNPLILGTEQRSSPEGSPPANEPSGESPSPTAPPAPASDPNRATDTGPPRSEGAPPKPEATPGAAEVSADERSKAERYVEMFGGEKVSNLPPAAVKALAKALDDNTRLANLAKGKEKPPAGGQKPDDGSAPDDATPAGPQTSEEIQAWAAQQAMEDPDGAALRNQYIPLVEEQKKILAIGANGAPVGGELFEVSKKLNYIASRMEFEADSLTDIEREDLEDQRGRLESRAEVLHNRYDRLTRQSERLADSYDELIRSLAGRVESELSAAQQAEEERAALAEATDAFDASWDAAVQKAAVQLTPDERARLDEALAQDAYIEVHVRDGKIGDPEKWVAERAPIHLRQLGLEKGRALSQTGDRMERLSYQPAPDGGAAVAPPQQQLSARERRREAERRTAERARRIVLQ